MKNKRVKKLVEMLGVLDGLIGERVNCFCISRNLHSELTNSYSEKEQRGAEKRYRIHIAENGGDILYEQAKKIFQ